MQDAPLNLSDFLSLQSKTEKKAIIFVYISKKKFKSDNRVGWSWDNVPSDEQLLERMTKYWYFGRERVEYWRRNPSRSPGYLVAVAGSPENRVVVGSVEVDSSGWEWSPGGCTVPTTGPDDLDALQVRGRKLVSSDFKFGRLRWMFFKILETDGRILDGRQNQA